MLLVSQVMYFLFLCTPSLARRSATMFAFLLTWEGMTLILCLSKFWKSSNSPARRQTGRDFVWVSLV
jgi:hypothetical protein